MAVTLNKANLVLKDINGNVGKIEQLSDRDIAKIRTAVSDVALVVNQSNHTPIKATANNLGVVKPDNNTIKIDSNGVLTATKATQDSAGQQINTTYIKGVTASNATITVTKGNGTTSTATINNVANATNATNLGGYPASDYIRSANLNTIIKNDGNDYYDDSDITSLIYAGNGAGTIRNEIANGNFSRVHPGQTIRGKATGTTYIVVGCNIYKYRGDTPLTRNHIGLMPIKLVGNAGNLLWSGRISASSSNNNEEQGYAPWASDNETKGKNQTSCYRDSYIAKTVLPKVDNLWLKPDFENQGISVLTFRNLSATTFDENAVCMSNPNWKGCATNWWVDYTNDGWTSIRLVLPSEPEIYGHYAWSGSTYESSTQHTQLPLFRHKEVHKVYPKTNIWLKDSSSVSTACEVGANRCASYDLASLVYRVCPIFLIA